MIARLRGLAHEGARYFGASALALAVDLGAYSGLIRLAGVHYLAAAPIGFSLGLAVVYTLSVRWVFRHRRLKDARAEFTLFALLGLAGLVLNEGIIYAGVEWLALGYEPAKLLSAGVVFCFNFGSRKLLLFTRY
jgi:putative flippase GtrA